MFEVIQLTTNRRWATMGDKWDKKMDRTTFLSLKVDRTAFTVASLEDVFDDKLYWLSRTPHERLRHVQILRQINYGHRATARLQRVLEFAQRE
jgi:hypothetical protein